MILGTLVFNVVGTVSDIVKCKAWHVQPSIHPFFAVYRGPGRTSSRLSGVVHMSLSLLLGDPEALPCQIRHLVLPVYSRVSYQLVMPRKPPKGDALEASMPKIPQSGLFWPEAAAALLQASSRCPMEEAQFCCLLPGCLSFVHWPKLMSIGECWNIFVLRFSSVLPQRIDTYILSVLYGTTSILTL